MADMHVVVVTPERTAIDERADFAVLPLFDGEKGVATNHTSFIARLGFGELRLRSGGTNLRYYIDAGFVQVRDNTVVVLTENIAEVDEIDVSAAEEQLRLAGERRPTTPEAFEERDRLVSQARAQLHMASRR